MRRFENKVALVTGAASGIGRATVERLASEGAKLVCADIQAEGAEEIAKKLQEGGAEALALACDVSDPQSAESAVRATVERFGALHVLCNIAGILRFDNTHELRLEDWHRIIEVNLTGTFLMCRAAIPHLIEARGAIVNMASTAALAAHPWTAAYSASKGGVLSLTYALALEYGKQGLRVNAACPGGIETPIHGAFRLPEGADPKLLQRILPFDGFAEAGAAADVIAFLASDDARHIQGTAVRVDGGMLM